MKKISKILVLTVALSVAATAGVFAQSFDDFKTGFGDFSTEVANTLPFASTTGLEWSDAKVRGFPRFGVGLSVGAVMMPVEAFKKLETPLGIDLSSFTGGMGLGVPFPGYTLDARIGIPLLPIDVGAKAGVITPAMADSIETLAGVRADYTLLGFDVRYAIIDGGLVLPAITASAGYNYMRGGITTSVTGLDTTISTPAGPIEYSDPKLQFAWESSNLDFKLQASKGLLIFTPTVGVGYTHGLSKAGGGISAELTNYPEELDQEYSDLDIDISDQGFTMLSSANGGAFRGFVGTQINLLVFKIDLNAKYNFNTQSLGGGLNLRFQI